MHWSKHIDDVRAQAHLVHGRQFRGEMVLAAVQVRAEPDAIVGDLAERAHAESLETAAVGQNRGRASA